MNERLYRVTFVLLEVVLLLAVPVLAFKGFDAVLDTTEGRSVDPELDPDDPGYEAFVTSSPALAVLGVDDAGQLSWAAILALGGSDRGGSIVLVPVDTVVEEISSFFVPEATLRVRYSTYRAEPVRQGLADLAGIEIGEVVELPSARLAGLLAPVSPLTVDNVDAVGDFAAGELSLDGAEVAQLLLASDPAESDLSRLARHEEVWRAWLTAIAASTDPDVVPGETASGIGRFLTGLASGPVTYDVPPVTETPAADGTTTFVADEDATFDLFEERVPFPAAADVGRRIRVKVLDGAGADGLAAAVGRDVVRAGGQVVVVGNADRFDAVASRLIYFDGALTDRVEEFAEEMGIEPELVDDANPDDRVDVIVVVGTVAAEAYGLPVRSRTTNGDDAG